MGTLTPRKQRAVMALAETGSAIQAAQAVGVTRTTIYRWIREPEFVLALRDVSGSNAEQAARRLTALMGRAVDVLSELLEHKNAHVRRLAAQAIISNGIRLLELTELESRIVILERKAGVRT